MPRPIRRLLVANRGEIARRVFRTAKAMGIETVAICAAPDEHAAFVREADFAVPLGGTSSAETYLDADRVLAAARRAEADAIHPGYGFLAENAAFARSVEAAGLCFVGPPAEAIETMGDKLAALKRVAKVGVPVLPRLTLGAEELPRPAEVARVVGFPLLVKASAGGGGKGMRVVREPAALFDALGAARREAARSFGDDTVFLERLVDPARHVEIQILADDERTLHLFERECSVQRRHQKVIEESPSPFLSPSLREALAAAAQAAARSVAYRGAGTVEFVVGTEGDFYFLEMNTRLQVEHPVTEAVTGVDLVRQQLLVAQGMPLEVDAVRLRGAAIEARVYAEDPAAGFLPAPGRLALFHEPAGVRVDGGVETGDEIGVHFDPMLAKVVAHAPTRAEAAAVLSGALAELRACGPATNRELLVRVLRHPAFLAGDTTTDFLDRHLGELLAPPDPHAVAEAAVTAALAARSLRLAADPMRLAIPPGWRNNRSAGENVRFAHGDRTISVAFVEGPTGLVEGEVDGATFSARLHDAGHPFYDLELDGLRRRVSAVTSGQHWWVQDASGAEICLEELPRFPPAAAGALPSGGLAAPMNGTVVHVAVAPGDPVRAGQLLLAIEAMKMEHPLVAPARGVVAEVLATEGSAVSEGQVLVIVDTDVDTDVDTGTGAAEEPADDGGPNAG